MCQACFDSTPNEDREPSDLNPHDVPLADWERELLKGNAPDGNPLVGLIAMLTGIPPEQFVIDTEEKNVDETVKPGPETEVWGLKLCKEIVERWDSPSNYRRDGKGEKFFDKIKLIKFIRTNRQEGYHAGFDNGLKKGIEESAKYTPPQYNGPRFHKADYYEMLQYRDATDQERAFYYLDSNGTVWVR